MHNVSNKGQRRWVLPLGVIVLSMVATIAALRWVSGGAAPVPEVFVSVAGFAGSPPTLRAAMEQAQQVGKPVLVFATADWCPPCQQMKKTTLSDDRVVGLIRRRTVPYYLDTDVSRSEAERLGVQGIPAFYIVEVSSDGGSAVGRVEPRISHSRVGYSDSAAFFAWLMSATPEPADQKADTADAISRGD